MASQEGKRSKATCGHSFHRDCLQEQLPQDLTNSGGTCKSVWGAKVFGTSSSTTEWWCGMYGALISVIFCLVCLALA